MGRGLGPVQKAIIGMLREHPLSDVDQISMVVYRSAGRESTDKELNSVQKAVKALEKRKLIKKNGISGYGNPAWIIRPPIKG